MNLDLTFVSEVLAFALFVWITMRYIWPPLNQAMAEREKKIADGLAAAERAVRDLELAQNKAVTILREAHQEAATIVDTAQHRAVQLIDQAQKRAQEQAARILEQGHQELELEVTRAREQLKTQLGVLSIEIAQKILEQEIDPSRHVALLRTAAERLQ
jgi:F-type H+-transporting ATPase subunit b